MPDEATAGCPSPDRLAGLLVDHVPPTERSLLEDHLEDCEGCRQTLERLAADPADWETWGRRLRSHRCVWPALTQPLGDADDPARWPRIPGYDVLGVLGRGGMGVVYKARKTSLNCLVALKVIRSARQGDPDYLRRFHQEATIVARLRHPNVVLVYDFGESGGWTYLTLELVEGGSLAQMLHDRPLPAREAARLVEALARAVHSAHQHGVVHRDLKPANVLLAPVPAGHGTPLVGAVQHGEKCFLPKVADFGLARLADHQGVTRSGDVMGTPEYMAPEQARAAPGWSTPAVDVYGLGAVLYEALTGRPPFRADTALATMCLLTDTEPVPPARLQPGLPKDLETVTLKCLRKPPGERYATALDLADDLRRFLAGEPIAARPIPGWARAGRWARRHPVVALLGALSAALLVGMLVVWAYFTADLRSKNVELDWLNTALTDESERVKEKQLETEQQQRTIDEQQRKIDDNLAATARSVRAYSELIRSDRQLRLKGDDPFRIGVLTRTLATYSDLVKLLECRERLRLECARAYHSMSGLCRELGKPDEANAYSRRAVAIWDALPAGTLVELNHALEPGICRVNLANMAFSRRRYDETETWYRQAIAVYQACKPTTPSEYAQREYHLALARNHLGYLLIHPRVRRLPEAARELAAAERGIRDSLKLNDLPLSRGLAGKIETNLGLLYEHLGQWADARAAYERTVLHFEVMARSDPDHTDYVTDLAVAYRQLGLLYRRHGAVEDALTVLRKAHRLRGRLVDGLPRVHRHRYEFGAYGAVIAQLHQKAGREEQAVAAYQESIPHLLQAAREAAGTWDYVSTLGEAVLLSSRLHVKRGTPVLADRLDATIAFLRPHAEREATREAAGKLLAGLDRLRGTRPVGSK